MKRTLEEMKATRIKTRTPLFRWTYCLTCKCWFRREPMSAVRVVRRYSKWWNAWCNWYWDSVCRGCGPTKVDALQCYINAGIL
jgi:hypothetical protein